MLCAQYDQNWDTTVIIIVLGVSGIRQIHYTATFELLHVEHYTLHMTCRMLMQVE